MPDLAELNLVIKSDQVTNATVRLKLLVDAAGKAEESTNKLTKSADNLGSSFGGLGGVLAKLLGGLSALAALKFVVQQAAQIELLTVSFKNLTKSADQAKEIMSGLQNFSLATGLPVADLGKAAQYLLAMKFNGQEVVPMLKTISDTARALGQGSQAIDSMSLALGQMKAKGAVSAQEMNQLANAGVGAWNYLAEAIGKTVPEAMKAAEMKQIDGALAVKAILQGLNRDFGGSAVKLADTAKVAWDRVVAAITTAAGKEGGIGDTILKAFNIVPMLNKVASAIEPLAKQLSELVKLYAPWIVATTEIVGIFLGLFAAVQAVTYAIGLLGAAFAIISAHPIIATLTALIALFIYMKDVTIQLGDQAVTVADLVNAAASVLWEELVKDVKYLADEIMNFFTWLKAMTVSVFTILQTISTDVLSKMGLNWGIVWQGFKEVAKSVANFVIASLVSIGDTIVAITRKFIDLATSFTALDFSHGAEAFAFSMVSVAVKMKAALDPTTISKEVLTDWKQNFGTDWVSVMGEIGKQGGQELKKAVIEAMGGPDSFVGKFIGGADNIIDKIQARAKQYATARGPTTGPSTQPSDDAKKTIDHINLAQGAANDKLAKYREKIQDMLTDLGHEQQLVGKTADERERMTRTWELQKLAAEAQITDQEEVNRLVDGYISKLTVLQEQQKQFERIKALGDDIGDAFSSSLTDAITQAKSLNDVFKDLANTIEHDVVQALVSKPIGEGIAGLITQIGTGGLGGLFGGGGSIPYQPNVLNVSAPVPIGSANGNVFSGGLFNGPTIFPMRGGARGIAGESGPEAIMPLARGADGRLGVRGGGGKTVNITQNVYAQDANSFKRSQRQIMQGVRDQLRD